MDNLKFLLIIGSFREEDVHQNYPLMSVIDEITLQSIPMRELNITSLNLSSTCDMIESYFNCSKHLLTEISEQIFLKTFGNPFYIKKILDLAAS
ncbi:MAG: hypothetical protein MJA31_14715 [Clostridia bacterium]|nr:hypothetical protein [Clostridia bacterium]